MSKRVKPMTGALTPEHLQEGAAYYAVSYMDQPMQVPLVETYIYIGTGTDEDHGEFFYIFQSAAAYFAGEPQTSDNLAGFSADGLGDLGTLERAVLELKQVLDEQPQTASSQQA